METNVIICNNYTLPTSGNCGDFSKKSSYYFYWRKRSLQYLLGKNVFSETLLVLYNLSLSLNSGTWRYQISLITDEKLDANSCEERSKILPIWVQYFQKKNNQSFSDLSIASLLNRMFNVVSCSRPWRACVITCSRTCMLMCLTFSRVRVHGKFWFGN